MMPFRFRKIIPFSKGFHINLSKGGISSSIGGKGFHLNLGRSGIRPTMGMPGTGLSYTQYPSSNKSKTNPLSFGLTCIISIGIALILCIMGLCAFVYLIPTTNITPTIQVDLISTFTIQTQNKISSSTHPGIILTMTPLAYPTSTLAIIPTFTPSASPFVLTTPIILVPAENCSCTGDNLNCKDFSNHQQAQSCYEYCISQGVGDINKLDQNNDGQACESLP